jgi:predicted RNA-binding protein with PIN domain
MVLLIDAYNVLKQMMSGPVTEPQRLAFIKKIDRYIRAKGHSAYIVFDGGDSHYPVENKRSSLVVIYAGYVYTADDILKKLCLKYRNQQAVLISSDRELGSFANMHNIACIDADLLDELLREPQAQGDQIRLVKSHDQIMKRPGHESSSDIDQLMQESAEHMLVKMEDGELPSRIKPRAAPSKIEKKIKRLVKKL